VKLSRRADRVRVPGFRFAGVRCGLKRRGLDVALVVADRPAAAAGGFSTKRAPAAPVVIARERVAGGRLAAVLVHAGTANACTGAAGLAVARAAIAAVARALGVAPAAAMPCATGRIGVQVPRARLAAGVRAALAALGQTASPKPRRRSTTDAFRRRLRRLRLGGRPVTVAALGGAQA
jgi:glutamate N-acetyltransferase/amino-acid N-acetyltransferase